MNNRLRIGIVGAGANTRERHIPGLRSCPGVEIVAVVNRSRESSERAARELDIPRVGAHWRELAESADIDAICIGTWPYLHAEVTIAALAAGKHVLCEARMAMNAAEAEAMRAALEVARRRNPGIVGQIVPSPFTLPYDRTVRRLLGTGALGRLQAVTLAHTHGGLLDPRKPVTWRQQTELSGVNTLTLGIYYEVLLRWLDEDVRVASAVAETLTPERPDGTGRLVPVTVPDRVSIRGRCAGGAEFSAEFSGIEKADPRNEIILTGDKATLRLDLTAGALWLQEPNGAARRIEPAVADRDEWRVEADFVASIRHGVPVRLTDFDTGVRYMRFTEAAWRAWQHGPQG
ncbi:MAG: Gfo/Idh/MocA family oxidoreductase [Opitutaceae bacterium]|nr:Gfo/Idh/MocA family oxidoreductase [Opitutaceae bacterium]